MLDQKLIGNSSEPQRFTITPEAVTEFIEATGDAVGANGQRDPSYVPLSFPTTFRLAVPGLTLDGASMQLIHGEQAYEYTRQLHVGEELICTARLLDIREKQGRSGPMTFVTTEIEGLDSQGQRVFTGKSILIVRAS